MIQIRGRPEKSVYQWETNLTLDFDCIADMFEWETPFLENALPIKPDAETSTKIPDELLQTDAAITVYAKNDGNVVETFTFGVVARKKPLDYIYTPSEIQSLTDLAERIRLIEESDGVTDEQIKNAVNDYFEKNPFEGGGSGGTGGLTAEQKKTLWDLIKIATFTENPAAAINAFKSAWNIEEENTPDIPDVPDTPDEPENPDVTLVSIEAIYAGGEVPVGTPLTGLTGITVRATYSDNSIVNITGYTLSGTIAEGSNIITVTYNGMTTTFTVVGASAVSGDIVNLFDKNTMIVENKYINATGSYQNLAGAKLARVPIEPNTTYALQIGGTYSGDIQGNLGSICMFDSSDTLICVGKTAGIPFKSSDGLTVYDSTLSVDRSGKGYTFRTVDNAAYLYFTAKLNDSKNFVDTIMLETGNTCHDYVSYVGGAE